jgi:hypothetical protein
MTKDNVDPGLLELDDEALIEEWVITTVSTELWDTQPWRIGCGWES